MMHKKLSRWQGQILLSGAICLAITTLAGCGEKNSNDLYNSLEQQVKHNTSYIEKEQINVNLELQAAINGNEKERVVKVLSNANIMNKPANEGTIVGSVKAQESVLVIGEDSVSGWYKVAYNGRVCYINGKQLDINTYVADSDDNIDVNNGDNVRPTTTVTLQRPVSTTSNKNNSTFSSNKKDEEETTTSKKNENGTTSSSGNNDVDNGNNNTTDNGNSGDDNQGVGDGNDNTTPEESQTSGGDNDTQNDTTVGDSSSEEETTTPTSPTETNTPTPEQPSEEETTTPPSDIEE
ncbi:MAG: hypothetical protein IIW92_11665 [Lachnospiraceae bacterium]|nr:hypothetical protein [Lachnospiraceae bacterium]